MATIVIQAVKSASWPIVDLHGQIVYTVDIVSETLDKLHICTLLVKKDDIFLSNYWDPFSSPKQCYTSQEHQNKTKLVLLF